MKKRNLTLTAALLALSIMLTGCDNSPVTGSSDVGRIEQSSSVSESSDNSGSANENSATSQQSSSQESSSQGSNIAATDEPHLIVRFGGNGEPFVMKLENNSTAAAIANYVGTSSWQLPIYSYDESEVMEYYDIPRRYEIPDNSATVTEAKAGDVFYSDPNRIVLYYADADINEEYTLIGKFDATGEFIDAVINNPVLEGWGNQIVIISDGE